MRLTNTVIERKLVRRCPACKAKRSHTARITWGREKCHIACAACGHLWAGRALPEERQDEARIVHVLREACSTWGVTHLYDGADRGAARRLATYGYVTLARGEIREPLDITATDAGREALAAGWRGPTPLDTALNAANHRQE